MIVPHHQPQIGVTDFKRKTNGTIYPEDFGNIRLALNRLGTQIAYDSFARVPLINGGILDEARLTRLWIAIADTFDFRPAKLTLHSLLTDEAMTAQFHPVRNYLAAQTWDGVPRLDTWLSTYGGAPNTPYVRAVGALVLIAAVRRVRSPGCKFDELLILESEQGRMKSTALRALCPNDEWFSDDLPLGVDSKLVIERTVGKWIVEASEMHGNRGREAEQLKAFLSRQTDGPVRLAYDHLATTVPRQFVIIATTNAKGGYLKDHTGARRFWPVTVERFDTDAMERDRAHLWAEAAMREAMGVPIRLDVTLWTDAGQEQEDRRAMDPWEPILEPLFTGNGFSDPALIPVETIWKTLDCEASMLNNTHADRVEAIAQRFGFKKARRYIDGVQRRYWIRVTAARDEQ
jgi:predicted P-loop ATPase